MKRTKIGAAAALMLVVALVAGSGNAGVYLGGGTVVYKEQGRAPAADNGTVVCHSTGLGVGGGCLPFTPGAFVEVLDVKNNHDVAFQVCIDNNGDSVCTDKGRRDPTADPCADDVFFSHDDLGQFHNPIGPLPTSRKPGCPKTGWNGYVVFLCQGVHQAKSAVGPTLSAPHTHETTIGAILNAGPMAPSGFGDFCGAAGGEQPVVKPYRVL